MTGSLSFNFTQGGQIVEVWDQHTFLFIVFTHLYHLKNSLLCLCRVVGFPWYTRNRDPLELLSIMRGCEKIYTGFSAPRSDLTERGTASKTVASDTLRQRRKELRMTELLLAVCPEDCSPEATFSQPQPLLYLRSSIFSIILYLLPKGSICSC